VDKYVRVRLTSASLLAQSDPFPVLLWYDARKRAVHLKVISSAGGRYDVHLRFQVHEGKAYLMDRMCFCEDFESSMKHFDMLQELGMPVEGSALPLYRGLPICKHILLGGLKVIAENWVALFLDGQPQAKAFQEDEVLPF